MYVSLFQQPLKYMFTSIHR